MVEVKIDPTTRIEGHHGMELEVEDGQITAAKSTMKMFRGAEIITVGRSPRDAAQLTGKVCGVCFICHRIASSRATEDAAMNAGAFDGIPKNAKILRDTVEGVFFLWNHAIHLFALAGPDYSDAVADTGFERLDPLEGEGYQGALDNQRKLMQALAEFGGRAPHPLAFVPGGVATNPDVATVESVKSRFREVSNWLGPTDAVPEVLENVQNGEFDPELGVGLHDVVSILVAAAREGAGNLGSGPNRYYSNGLFRKPDSGERIFKRGVYRDGSFESMTKDEIVEAISEDTEYSYYTNASGGKPTEAQPPEPAPQKDDAYSWGKAPRFDGETMEVGPLARLTISGYDPFDLRANLGGGSDESNTLNRLIARAQEVLLVRDRVLDLLDAFDPSAPLMADFPEGFTGTGVGLWEPSRGTLSHYVDVEDGTIERYQIITPTLWNIGPRDDEGNPSIIEGAIVGDEVADIENPMNVMRTIRSFDPCLACSVHVDSPEGSYETELTPASPGGLTDVGSD